MTSPAALPGAPPPLRASLLDPSAAAHRPYPEKVLQFGEGNFLRAFADWMIGRMNERGLFGGRAVLVQPLPTGMARALNAQDGLYTVILRGLSDGQVVQSRELVSAVSRCIDPHVEHDQFLACARNPDLRFVVSNTTEAGIRTDPADAPDARPPASFPGKLTQLLYARFQAFAGDPARGLVMLPCELVERNGDALRRAVVETARAWALPAAFHDWLEARCLFTSTLVDRIVTGYPADEAAALGAALGYRDELLVAGEVFHSWVIESPHPLEDALPLRAAGLDVVWTRDITPYRERKVRILNGAHTMTALAAYLAGLETVLDVMNDRLFRAYLAQGIEEEILPTLTLPPTELVAFARSVLERFENPFIKHQLLSIALNSVSKYRARILGTVLDYARIHERLPPRLTFALAALIAFYRGHEIRDGALIGTRAGAPYRIQDEPAVLGLFRDAWRAAGARPAAGDYLTLAHTVLSRADLWGQDLGHSLPGLQGTVAAHVADIQEHGVRAALQRAAG